MEPKMGSVTLLIAQANIEEELDTGGEIGEVSQCLSDDGSTMELRTLPSGKRGWVDASCLRLPVGFLPSEWRGKSLIITFALNEVL